MNAIATHTASRRQTSRGRLADGSGNPIDVHVGHRVRLRRTLLGMSQEKLGEALGLTFQQVQKYERGANRVGASRLFDLGRVLDVPVSFFFDAMSEEVATASPAAVVAGTAPTIGDQLDNAMTSRETLELVRAYYRITNPDVRKRVCDLAKALAAAAAGEAGNSTNGGAAAGEAGNSTNGGAAAGTEG